MANPRFRLAGATLGSIALLAVASSVRAQVSIGIVGPADSGIAVCVLGTTLVAVSGDDCNGTINTGVTYVGSTGLYFGNLGAPTQLLSNGEAYFQYYTQFDGETVFNGTTSFNGPLNFSGNLTADGLTSTGGFTNTGAFLSNGGGRFTGTLTTGSLNTGGLTAGTGVFSGGLNSSQLTTGAINASTLFTSGGATVGGFFTASNGSSLLGLSQIQSARISQNLTVLNGATVTMGGNRVQNVGGPVAGTDAANKDYVDTALAVTNAVNTRQDQELNDIRAVNSRQDQELTDVRAVNTRQDQELDGVRTVNTRQDQELSDVRAVNTQQAGQIAAVQTVNTRQDQELSDVRAVNTQQAGQITALQAVDALHTQQIAALQTGQAALLGQLDETRRDLNETNEGVAMGLAMESPALPPGTNFALSGGVGYFNDRSAMSTAFTARISPNASFSAGIGVGLNSGKVGARGGFQIAW